MYFNQLVTKLRFSNRSKKKTNNECLRMVFYNVLNWFCKPDLLCLLYDDYFQQCCEKSTVFEPETYYGYVVCFSFIDRVVLEPKDKQASLSEFKYFWNITTASNPPHNYILDPNKNLNSKKTHLN